MKIRVFLISMALVTLAVFPGCLFSPTRTEGVGNYYLSSGDSLDTIRRVGCLPLQRESFCYDDLSTIQLAFLQELRRKGPFEVVSLEQNEADSLSKLDRRKGAYPSDWILELKNSYRLDAILIAHVTNYNPYKPKKIGVKGDLIDGRTGDVVWSVDVLFDAGVRGIAEDMKWFYQDGSGVTESPFDWRLPFYSKKHFLQYAFSRIFQTLTKEFRKRDSEFHPRGPVIQISSPLLP